MSGFLQKRVIPTCIIFAVAIITIAIQPDGWPFRILFIFWSILAIIELHSLLTSTAPNRYLLFLAQSEVIIVWIGACYVFSTDYINVILLMLCTWVSDGAALVVGSLIGGRIIKRHPFPRVSPNKTWEGCIAQMLIAIIITAVFIQLHLAEPAAWIFAIAGLLSLFGDLLDSYIKRQFGIKDSCDIAKQHNRLIAWLSHVLQGHGGCLDRIDSVVFTGTVLMFVQLIVL